MIQRLRQPYLRQRLRRRIAKGARQYIFALIVWSAWAIASVILRLWLGELGLFLAVVLFGAIAIFAFVHFAWWLRVSVKLDRHWDEDYKRESEHLINDLVSPRRPMPPFDSHMASPDLLQCLWQLIHEERPNHVLELGSGLSTLVMAYAVEACGKGTITSMDDSAGYAVRTRRYLREHSLEAHANVITARFERLKFDCGVPFWYALPDLRAEPPIDILFVDGPMRTFHPRIRYPALPVLHEYFADNAFVVVDDRHKLENFNILREWLEEYPALRIDERFHNPRFTVLRFSRLPLNAGDVVRETAPAHTPSPAG